MNTLYNQIAGQNVGRLASLSDGIFAVAMTLLVLDLRSPPAGTIHTEDGLWRALIALLPQVIMFAMSFMTLGIFWVGQQTQLNHLVRGDRHLAWIHIGFLFAVSMMPFSTKLLAEFIAYRLALFLYWGNIAALGSVLYASWRYAIRADLVKEDLPRTISTAIEQRIIIAQTLYAVGALLSLISTYLSIGFIVLVQLNYVIAPRIFGAEE